MTLYDYGMNWDSPIHFARGQAFLRYIMTRKKNYDGLPLFCFNKEHLPSQKDYKTGEICDRHRTNRISEYQSSFLDFNWAIKDVYGHPPLGDILLAATNQLFFVKLGLLEDIQAYHLLGVFSVFLLSLAISLILAKTYGNFASMIGVLVMYSYPLLFSEQHFNVKDPTMGAFFGIGIFLFWLAIKKKSAWYMILSALAGSISFGTKINYVFAPIILFPWFLCIVTPIIYSYAKEQHSNFLTTIKELWQMIPKKLAIVLLLYPVIIAGIFYASWPSFWFNPIKTFQSVFKFYIDVGVSACPYAKFSSNWLLKCSSSFAMKYFLYTTPLVSLFFLIVGTFVCIRQWKRHDYLPLLLLSFFYITLLRVTLSISSIYGGIRQIMEFIGPMAMIAAIGAVFLRDIFVRGPVRNFVASCIICSCFIPIGIKLFVMHPNENVYFNPLIGGLHGAAKDQSLEAGNTYGNAYVQGVKWLNSHAEKNARIALIYGLGQNISRSSLRSDFSFGGGLGLSGYNQKGEYAISLINQTTSFSNAFDSKYYSLFLKPVYEVKVEDVPLLQIWHNVPETLLPGVNFNEQKVNPLHININDSFQLIVLPQKRRLKRLEINYENKGCDESFLSSEIFYSVDGKTYIKDPNIINDFTTREIAGYQSDRIYLFAGDTIQYIKIVPHNYECRLDKNTYTVYAFS